MKYRLKKKLPLFANIGTEVDYREDVYKHLSIGYGRDSNENPVIYLRCDPQDLRQLLEDGWIEEVKPRELWVELFRDTGSVSDANDEREMLREDKRFTIIKVREVIE